MSSRREEERNEKIIRGLMKLPPNRRCINCNSLGPQYVCTNFWMFVCITCSGIHREFTHRVKSVSMAKFTSQEVEALQRGGNQRAREMFLKDWDLQRQRLPDSSNVDRVREFIKNVYVDRKYAGGTTSDKPPRDIQSLRNHEDDTRRASSYHSYSQSPPYENQYEDRRYGRHGGVLSRKPGSDRGYYEGKISSFVYSPGRLGEQMYEDRFANEGSGSRVSDYSMSSAGDPFRSDTQSPNYQDKLSSPPINPVRDILVEDARRQTMSVAYSETTAKRDADGNTRTQRTASLGSFGSFDSNSMSLKSINSGSLADVVSEPEQSIGTHLDEMSPDPSLSQSSVSANAVGLDLFSLPVVQQPATSSAPSTDFFKPPANSSAPSLDLFKPPETSSVPPLDLFADITHQHSATTSLEQKPLAVSFPENEGWATFDLPRHEASVPETKNASSASIAPGDVVPFRNFNVLPSINANAQQPSVNSTVQGPFSSVDNQWHGGLHEVQAFTGPTSTAPWNAFEDSLGSLPEAFFENLPHKSEPQVVAYNPPSTANQYLSPKVSEGEMPSHATDWKSTNPFDLPYDSDLEPSNMFLDMSSLQAALPDPQMPPAFVGGLTQPWFPQNSVTPYIPAAPQGGLAYMGGESPTPQLSNIPSQGPVASLGGNPFA